MFFRFVIVVFLLIFIPAYLPGTEIILSGRNVIWSPDSDEFIYYSYGKTYTSKTWRIYSLKTKNDIDTVFKGEDTIPTWSQKGNKLAYADNNVIKIQSSKSFNEVKTPIIGIRKISWAGNEKEIVYSNGESIYILDILSGRNSLFTSGCSPEWLKNKKGIAYINSDFEFVLYNTNNEHAKISSDINSFKVSFKGNLIVFENAGRNELTIISMNASTTNTLIFKDVIYGFGFSGDEKYLLIGMIRDGLYLYDVVRGLKFKLGMYGIFPSWSASSSYISFEKQKKIYIRDSISILKSLDTSKIYKVSLGKGDGLKIGEELSVYEEITNPLTGEITGFDKSKPKGKLKIISSFPGHSFGKLLSDSGLEIGDAVYFERLKKNGRIENTE